MNKKSRILAAATEVENELDEGRKTPSVSPFNRLARLVTGETMLTPEERESIERLLTRTKQRINNVHFIQEWESEMERQLNTLDVSDTPYVLRALKRCRDEKDIIHFCARYIIGLGHVPSLAKEHEKRMFMANEQIRKDEQLHWHNYRESLMIQNILYTLERHPISQPLRSLWIKVLEDHYSKTIGRLKKSLPADPKVQALQVRSRKSLMSKLRKAKT